MYIYTHVTTYIIIAMYLHTLKLIMVFSLYTAKAKHNAHTTTARKHQKNNDNDDDNPLIYIIL